MRIETLHPFLEAIIGKVQVEHPNREHDTAIVDTSFLEQLLQSDNIGQKERRQGKKLVSRMLPHVSDCDGLAVMVELLPECQIKSIISARDTAIKENISLLKWAKDLRLRSFRDTYYRDYYATHNKHVVLDNLI